MASLRKRGKVWHYRFVDADGVMRERKGCPDKRETEAMAAAAELEVSKIRSGVIDPRALAYRTHEARAICDHLSDWHATLLGKGGTAKHAKLFRDRARRVVELAKAKRLSDLTPSRVQESLAALKAEGLSLQTCNHHRSAIRGFSRWAWKDGRLREDVLVGVSGFNTREDRRHDRRTLSLDELRRLIATAQVGRSHRGMNGPARALCYRLAVATGLRYSEIKSVTPESFDFRSGHSTVTVQAGYTKNGQKAVLPLSSDLAPDLER